LKIVFLATLISDPLKLVKKARIYLIAGVFGVGVLFLLLKVAGNRQTLSRLPEIPESLMLSSPVGEQLSQALTRVQRRPNADNLGKLGMVFHSSANYQEAAACYRLAAGRSSSSWIWNYYLGYLSLEMADSDEIIRSFTSVTQANPGNNLAWYYLGEAYRNQGKYEQAETSYAQISTEIAGESAKEEASRVDHFPLRTYARFQLARIYNETGRKDLAENTLREILQSNRNFGPAYRLLGNIFYTNGDTLAGKRYTVRANDLLVFTPPVDTLVDRLVRQSRSELYLLKKIDEAERSIYDQWARDLVYQGLTYLPENKYLISKAIAILMWMGLEQEALEFTDRHLALFKDSYSELKKTGLLFFVNGSYQQASVYLNRASDIQANDLEVQKPLLVSFAQIGEKQKSDQIVRELYENNRSNPDVLAGLAEVLFFELGDVEKALIYLNHLKQLSPSHPKAFKVSAGIAEKNGALQKATSLYEISFNTDPGDITTTKNLANLLYRQQLWERTIRHYREALVYHPNEPSLLERLGTLLVLCPDPSLRNSREALEYLERAFIHMSSRPNVLLTAGRSLSIACANLGDKASAIRTIQQTMEIGQIENIPQGYQEELEQLHQAFLAMEN
jgi:tetratricopeptide (TPR) repeat protein